MAYPTAGGSFQIPYQILSWFQEELIDVTLTPVLSRLERHDDGMLGGLKVFGRMLVLRIVAAADVATNHTNIAT
jgi:hypothetical protein